MFSFSISFLVLEIFRFFKTCKLGVSDVIYSRIINYIYKIVNISVNNKQNSFKLYMSIAIIFGSYTPQFLLFDCNMDSFGIIASKLYKYSNSYYFFTLYNDLNSRNMI